MDWTFLSLCTGQEQLVRDGLHTSITVNLSFGRTVDKAILAVEEMWDHKLRKIARRLRIYR